MERNCLMENVYPKIKEYCKEKHGLEFQVVDMRWGVRDEATDDHMTTELCMNEIKNCQRLSVGPNFVTFLGQKYGYRPIPTYIESQEFSKIIGILNELNVSEVELLYTWYREDTNAIPSTFILQPISSILIHFNNKKEPDLMQKDQSIWWETLGKLQQVLRLAANELYKRGLMTNDEKHNYFMAVTEREVINGVLKLKETRNTCLAYVRQIQKINMSNTKQVSKFVDLLPDGEVDAEAAQMLADLRDERLVTKIHPDNIIKFKLSWSDREGLNEDDHYEYLITFINHFYRNIVKLVRRAMRKQDVSSFGKIVTEILQHGHACSSVSKIFLGREAELQSIKEYVTGSLNRPLILHGAGGSGKTCLLAKAASMVRSWLGKDKCILVLRFLGTTPDSSSVIPALTSICQQLAYNYTLPMDDMPDDLIPLMFYYKQLLLNASHDQPLIIFLDSVDQLDGPMVSLRLSWLTYELPDHVKIVISTSSDGGPHSSSGAIEEYKFLKKALEKTDAIFLEVKTLDRQLAVDVITAMLKDKFRTLTRLQWDVVNSTIDHCTLPIFLKLVCARVSAWKSYSLATQLPWSVMESIMNLFDRVELQHGKTLVSYALSYITASKCGLSESELEDLISLDDIVLNDIFQYHLPPIRRIPPLLWTRIRSDLPNYLSERDADGVSVMNWYHRQFREASIIRYLNDTETTKYFHSMIADYFIGTWGGGTPKPFQYTEIQKSRFNLTSDEGAADRKVPLQPNVYYGSDGQIVRFNGRKFGELPFHLTRSQRFSDLFSMVLFNYEWLHSKLSCCPLQSVLTDFEDARKQLKSVDNKDNLSVREVQLLIDAIKLSAAILIQYPSMLAPQIVGRLLPLKDECPNIASLLEQCDRLGVNHCALTPINHCLHTPGGPLMYSLEGHSFAVFDFILTSDNRYILSVSNKFLMWDLSTGEVSREVDPKARGIMKVLVITGDDKLALTYSNYNDVWALDILTGEVFNLPGEKLGFPSEILGIEVASDNRTAVVWCKECWASFLLRPNLSFHQKFFTTEEIDPRAEIIFMRYESVSLFHVTFRMKEVEEDGLQLSDTKENEVVKDENNKNIPEEKENVQENDKAELIEDGKEDDNKQEKQLSKPEVEQKEEQTHKPPRSRDDGLSNRKSTTTTSPTSDYFLQSFVEGEKVPIVKFRNGITITDDGRCYAGNLDGNIDLWTLRRGVRGKHPHLLTVSHPFNLDVISQSKLESWSLERTLPPLKITEEEGNIMLSIIESHRSDFIVGVKLRGFVVYPVETKSVTSKDAFKPKYLSLPPGIRNIAVQPLQVVSRILFTKYNQYAVAGIRRNLYIWSVSETSLMKVIDAHYGRIVEMLPLVVDDINAVATSSLDRTVKVWNIKNIFEQVYTIDRMELPIDSLTFSSNLAATVTRSCVGIWDLKTGKLLTTLSNSPIGAIITHAVMSDDGNFLIAIESGHIIVWNLKTFKSISRVSLMGLTSGPSSDIKHLQCVKKAPSFLLVSEEEDLDKEDKYTPYKVSAFDILKTEELKYAIDFNARKKEPLKPPVVTIDGSFVVVAIVDIDSDKDILQVYDSSSGTFLHTISLPVTSITRLLPTCHRGKECVVAVLSPGLGILVEVASERILSKVSRWNEACSRDGSVALYAFGSGLEIVELSHGSTVRVLLPKVSEGLVTYVTGFTLDDEYVYYYHSTKRTIRLFRVCDGQMIANYRLSAEARVIAPSPDSSCLVIGSADGSLIILLIADPKKHETQKVLQLLSSRREPQGRKPKPTPLSRWKAAVRLIKTINSGSRAASRKTSIQPHGTTSSICCVS